MAAFDRRSFMPTKLGWRHFIIASVLLLGACFAPPPTVAEITVVNGTPYDLEVEVNGGDRESWLPVAIAEAGTTDVVHQVIDQGEVWIFRFRHWGDPVGELSLTRAELERNGWKVQVPETVSQHLRQLGRPETTDPV
jgi:hypothetical protein